MTMDMCRVCLSTEKNMLPLDADFVHNYNLLTNLNIRLLDGMPQHSCWTCVNTVKYFVEFRDKSITSENTLREIICSDIKISNKTLAVEIEKVPAITENVVDIKAEIKEEDEVYDSTLDNYEVSFTDFDDQVQDMKDIITTKEEKDIKSKNKEKKKLKKIKNKEVDSKASTLLKQITDELKNKWLCGICPKTFDSKSDVNSHLDIHKTDRICAICKEVANSLSQLFAHRLNHVPVRQFRCHICNKRFRSTLNIEQHYRKMHIEGENTELSCNLCSFKHESLKRLKRHIFHDHSDTKYICDFCSKIFRCKDVLKSHIKQHSDNKSYVCDLCGFSCKYAGGLTDHKLRKHNPKKVCCKTCRRPFPNQDKFDLHKCTERLSICPLCGIRLTGDYRLSRHMMTHSDIYLYECDRCPAKFKTKGALKAHIDRHDGNRTHKCEYCPAKFYTASVLIKHRRIHTGERPYVCKVCHKGFTGNNNLKVHMKVHGEYLIVKKNTNPEGKNNVIS